MKAKKFKYICKVVNGVSYRIPYKGRPLIGNMNYKMIYHKFKANINENAITIENIKDYCIEKYPSQIVGLRKGSFRKCVLIRGDQNKFCFDFSYILAEGINKNEFRMSPIIAEHLMKQNTNINLSVPKKSYCVLPVKVRISENKWVVGYMNYEMAKQCRFKIELYNGFYADPKKYKDDQIYDITSSELVNVIKI